MLGVTEVTSHYLRVRRAVRPSEPHRKGRKGGEKDRDKEKHEPERKEARIPKEKAEEWETIEDQGERGKLKLDAHRW